MGDKNRIVHNFGDGTLEKIMGDIDHKRIKKNSNWFFDHPAYYGTSIQQKTIRRNRCERCAYFIIPESGIRKRCCFPWNDPKEYDTAILGFLPCKGRKKDEKD